MIKPPRRPKGLLSTVSDATRVAPSGARLPNKAVPFDLDAIEALANIKGALKHPEAAPAERTSPRQSRIEQSAADASYAVPVIVRKPRATEAGRWTERDRAAAQRALNAESLDQGSELALGLASLLPPAAPFAMSALAAKHGFEGHPGQALLDLTFAGLAKYANVAGAKATRLKKWRDAMQGASDAAGKATYIRPASTEALETLLSRVKVPQVHPDQMTEAQREVGRAVEYARRAVKSDVPGELHIETATQRLLEASRAVRRNPEVQGVIDKLGLRSQALPEVTAVDPARGRQMAQAYERLKSTPTDPATQAAYRAFAGETRQQYQALQDAGYTFDFVKKDPYKNSAAMRDDLLKNKHLSVFKSEEGGHPMLSPEENDIFRAVHDAVGHGAGGYGFTAAGEENAFRKHLPTFSPEAQRAMATETRGQNSWVNFGPHSAKPAPERPFAAQKAALWPTEHMGDYHEMPAPKAPGMLDRLQTRLGINNEAGAVGGAPHIMHSKENIEVLKKWGYDDPFDPDLTRAIKQLQGEGSNLNLLDHTDAQRITQDDLHEVMQSRGWRAASPQAVRANREGTLLDNGDLVPTYQTERHFYDDGPGSSGVWGKGKNGLRPNLSPAEYADKLRASQGDAAADNFLTHMKGSQADQMLFHGTAQGPGFDRFTKGQFGFHVGTLPQAEDILKGYRNGHGAVMPLWARITKPFQVGHDLGHWNEGSVIEQMVERRLITPAEGQALARETLKGKNAVTGMGVGGSDTHLGQLKMTGMGRFDTSGPVRAKLEELGFDGIEYPNLHEGQSPDGDSFSSYIAFRPEQLKSALGNNGNFSKRVKSVLGSLGGSEGRGTRMLAGGAIGGATGGEVAGKNGQDPLVGAGLGTVAGMALGIPGLEAMGEAGRVGGPAKRAYNLSHFSPLADLKTLDPLKAGTNPGVVGAERASGARGTHYFMEDTPGRYEAAFDPKYHPELTKYGVKGRFALYDMAEDPQGIAARTLGKGKPRESFEQALRTAGYDGFTRSGEGTQFKQSAVLLKPQAVSGAKLGRAGAAGEQPESYADMLYGGPSKKLDLQQVLEEGAPTIGQLEAAGTPAPPEGSLLRSIEGGPTVLKDVPQVDIPRPEPAVRPETIRRGLEPWRKAIKSQRMMHRILSGVETPQGPSWYLTDPVYESAMRVLGPEAGMDEAYNFMGLIGATSPRNRVQANLRLASMLRAQVAHELPIGGTRGYPMLPVHGDLAEQWMENGRFGMAPKASGFAANLQGNWKPLTSDTHHQMLNALFGGVEDPGMFRLRPPIYRPVEELQQAFAQKLANSGVLRVPAGKDPTAALQSVQWLGGSAQTGVASGARSFSGHFEDALHRTSEATGMHPTDVEAAFWRDRLPLLGLLGAAGGGGVSDKLQRPNETP